MRGAVVLALLALLGLALGLLSPRNPAPTSSDRVWWLIDGLNCWISVQDPPEIRCAAEGGP